MPPDVREGETPALRDAAQWLCDYFGGRHPSPRALTLAPDVSAFQAEVLALLLELPEGQTVACLIPLGYPAEEPAPPKRKEVSDLLSYK